MRGRNRKPISTLLEDFVAGIKKRRKPDEYEISKIANAWMIIGFTVFVIFAVGTIVTDTLSAQNVLDWSIYTYNRLITLILGIASLTACYYLLSQGVCHWSGIFLLIEGLTSAFSASSVLMYAFSSPIPFYFIFPIIALLLVSMEIVYRKGRNTDNESATI